jgi:DNA-damage-inducible protein D
MPDESGIPHTSPFDAIRHIDENGNEYWSARELYKVLGYTEWRNFHNVVIKRAMKACEENGQVLSDHFVRSYNMMPTGKGAQRKVQDHSLSRYAAYLVVMNGDPSMPVVAHGQTYFAIQTRRQELADQLATLPEDEDQKRLELRNEMRKLDTQLKIEASKAGATHPRDFAIFFNHGYRGLYGGETEDDIHTRKGLKPKEKILDHMGSDELIYNAFRATLTKHRLEREHPIKKEQANRTHYEVGSDVRETIKRQGGPLPEELPTPEKSIRQLKKEQKREEQKRIERQRQPELPLLLDEGEGGNHNG